MANHIQNNMEDEMGTGAVQGLIRIRVSQKQGYLLGVVPFGGSHHKGYSSLGSKLGSAF